ncbi:hypothetical protein Nepgr_000888 [Nepenthes gracilis]|uniref:Uncharacterized protein n=1 Tax=Nepenthes gracilis TaxID=150966 RepID=A0AAD3P782_NEPGR|nr:hypothetical protein Nepgr_000888 [Nepenthes gracilis]
MVEAALKLGSSLPVSLNQDISHNSSLNLGNTDLGIASGGCSVVAELASNRTRANTVEGFRIHQRTLLKYCPPITIGDKKIIRPLVNIVWEGAMRWESTILGGWFVQGQFCSQGCGGLGWLCGVLTYYSSLDAGVLASPSLHKAVDEALSSSVDALFKMVTKLRAVKNVMKAFNSEWSNFIRSCPLKRSQN